MQIVVCAGKSRVAPGTSSEQVLLWAADTDGSSLWCQPFSWPSTLLVLEDAASYSLLVSAYLRLQLSHSPPMPLHHSAFASAPAATCLMIFLILMFDSQKSRRQEKRERENDSGWAHVSMLFLFKPLATLSSLAILLLCLYSHNPSCTQLSTHSASAPLQLSETRGKHTVTLTHLKFMIMNLKRVLGLILQSLCISLVHSLSCPSRWTFPSCLLLSSQTSSTSFLFLLSMDDFAFCFNEKIGAIRRELP